MRRLLPCVSREPLPIRLRVNALDHGLRTGPAPRVDRGIWRAKFDRNVKDACIPVQD